MPRYFFDTHDGREPHVDEHGVMLADDEAARQQARRAIAEMALDQLPRDGNHHLIHVAVRRGNGTRLFHARLEFDLENDS